MPNGLCKAEYAGAAVRGRATQPLKTWPAGPAHGRRDLGPSSACEGTATQSWPARGHGLSALACEVWSELEWAGPVPSARLDSLILGFTFLLLSSGHGVSSSVLEAREVVAPRCILGEAPRPGAGHVGAGRPWQVRLCCAQW